MKSRIGLGAPFCPDFCSEWSHMPTAKETKKDPSSRNGKGRRHSQAPVVPQVMPFFNESGIHVDLQGGAAVV